MEKGDGDFFQFVGLSVADRIGFFTVTLDIGYGIQKLRMSHQPRA